MVEFNKSKKNQQYFEDSLVHMIEIYLSPEQDLYYSLTEESLREVDNENIKACELLLREMQSRGSTTKYVVMNAYVMMMNKKKN